MEKNVLKKTHLGILDLEFSYSKNTNEWYRKYLSLERFSLNKNIQEHTDYIALLSLSF